MKIGFFTDTYRPTVDGVVMMIDTLRRAFEKKGHEVFVFAPGTIEDIRRHRKNHVFYYKGVVFPPYPSYKLAVWPYNSVKIVKRLGLDIIHSHGVATTSLAALLCSRYAGIPSVATYHTIVTDAVHYITEEKGISKLVEESIWMYLKMMYGMYDIVTCPSNYIKKKLEERGIHACSFPNGINTRLFRQVKCNKRLFGLNGNERVLLHVGRMVKEKNLDLVIRALRYLPMDVYLVLIGDGPARGYYEHLALSLGVLDRIIFMGYIPNRELPKYYSSADCFVFASTFDTQGLVALESMACGTPIVALRNTAVEELIVEGVTGYLFDPEPYSASETILNGLNLKLVNKQTPSQARKTAVRFSMEKTAERFLLLYDYLIDKRIRNRHCRNRH